MSLLAYGYWSDVSIIWGSVVAGNKGDSAFVGAYPLRLQVEVNGSEAIQKKNHIVSGIAAV